MISFYGVLASRTSAREQCIRAEKCAGKGRAAEFNSGRGKKRRRLGRPLSEMGRTAEFLRAASEDPILPASPGSASSSREVADGALASWRQRRTTTFPPRRAREQYERSPPRD